MHNKLLAAALLAVGLSHAIAQEKIDTPNLATLNDSKAWKLTHTTAEPAQIDGKPAVRLVSQADSANGIVGLAIPAGLTFTTGTIDIDLKGKNVRGRSFLGVAFNVVDEKTFEAVYFRPFNFKADEPFRDRAVQYIAWPANTWEHLRKNSPGKFEHRIEPVPDPDGWFHARIDVTERQLRVFVNDAKEAALVVERLATGGVKRPMGLFVDSADGDYANLKVTHR